ncbi:MAG: hypothetical protein GY783_15820 [Gammaproteobacteria bacterium]|nr:hypothetical protein [Gammaproteobacteria bacterium]
MKLRIRQNSIRLRLKRGEVDQIASGKSIIEETHFPDSVLTYRLDVSDDGKFSMRFNEGNLVIRVPVSELTQWAETDQVSIVAEQALGDSGTLSLLIEKDFSCLAPGHHRPDEDDADTYPHPEASSGGGC